MIPRDKACTHLVGPDTVTVQQVNNRVHNVMTFVDLAIGWFEIAEIPEKTKCKNHILTTIQNPQANKILERFHQVLGSILRTIKLQDHGFDGIGTRSELLPTAVTRGVYISYHTILQVTPRQLIFDQDMSLNVKFIADCEVIRFRK